MTSYLDRGGLPARGLARYRIVYFTVLRATCLRHSAVESPLLIFLCAGCGDWALCCSASAPGVYLTPHTLYVVPPTLIPYA